MNPDLASILRSLSDSNQSAPPRVDESSAHSHQNRNLVQDGNELSSLLSLLTKNEANISQHGSPPQLAPTYPRPSESYYTPEQRTSFDVQRSNATRSAAPTQKQLSDSSNIVDWASGLRYVTRVATTNDQFEPAIRKMIKNQNDNEKQWFTGRQTLIQQQKDRVENKKKLDDVLSSVGGFVKTDPEIHDNEAELQRYDEKVHRAMKTMAKAMTAELSSFNVPFFNTRPELSSDGNLSPDSAEEFQRQSQLTITKAQLRGLQRRMLEYLQDMYSD